MARCSATHRWRCSSGNTASSSRRMCAHIEPRTASAAVHSCAVSCATSFAPRLQQQVQVRLRLRLPLIVTRAVRVSTEPVTAAPSGVPPPLRRACRFHRRRG